MKKNIWFLSAAGLCLVFVAGIVISNVGASSPSNALQMMDVNPNGQAPYSLGTTAGSENPSISRDGRYVAFASNFQNLVTSPTNNGKRQVYIRDRLNDVTRMISVNNSGVASSDGAYYPRISADGRYVTYMASSTNLTSIALNGGAHIFRFDTRTNTVSLVDYNGSSVQASTYSQFPSISADGKYVAFTSSATNLDPNFTPTQTNVYVRNMDTGTVKLVGKNRNGTLINGIANAGMIDCSGTKVLFLSSATSLVSTGSVYWNRDNAYVADMNDGMITTVTDDANEAVSRPAISCSGSYVTYASSASNLFVKSTPRGSGSPELGYRYDMINKDLALVSKNTSGSTANASVGYVTSNDDGRFVAFDSGATNLDPAATGGGVFVRDMLANTTVLMSKNASGQASSANQAFMNASGEYVGFVSGSTTLLAIQPDPAGGANGDHRSKGAIYVQQTGQNYTY